MRRLARNLLASLMMFCAASTTQASEYIARDNVVIDLRFGTEWLRCTVGQVWGDRLCRQADQIEPGGNRQRDPAGK